MIDQLPTTTRGWENLTGSPITTYPVGLLRDLHILRHRYRIAAELAEAGSEQYGGPRAFRRMARRAFYRSVRGILGHLRDRRDWRAFRNEFNGYLAELDSGSDGRAWAMRCGRGWSPAAAERRLVKHLRIRHRFIDTAHELSERADIPLEAAVRMLSRALRAGSRRLRRRAEFHSLGSTGTEGQTPTDVTPSIASDPEGWICGKCARAGLLGVDDDTIPQHHRSCAKAIA